MLYNICIFYTVRATAAVQGCFEDDKTKFKL